MVPHVPFGARAAALVERERVRFFLWSPVALGAGIAAYFALGSEPPLWLAVMPVIAALLVQQVVSRGTLTATAVAALLLAASGFTLAKLRVENVRAPVLEKNMRGVLVTGKVTRVEPRPPRGARLTIAVEQLGNLPDSKRPQTIRVRMLSNGVAVKPGDRVRLTASLAPPAKPAVPGGFDFARTAWFERLGGVGYTFSKPIITPRGEAETLHEWWSRGIESLRQSITARIQAVLPGETGAIASALISGERGGITQATNDAYRGSGLFHILSISGLHMVIMAGAVFYSVRLLLAAIPSIALRFPIKKWAAVAGIIGALGYLSISGGAFATVRSALMIVVIFGAVLLDRPALALRNVALSAFVILVLYPESLFDAGFQMSFAAVTGLVATYEEVRRRMGRRNEPHPVLRVLLFFGGIVFSTVIASVAVAPFAVYHFHQSQQYAVLANLVAIPICNIVVMPAALAALVLMPLGLEALALVPMGLGIDAMSWCANFVAKLPGAVGHLPAIPQLAFVLMVLGGLWLALWQSRLRILGIAFVLGGVSLAPFAPRPDVLIARNGELVALRGADGRLSALPARQSKYELERWLEHDGDARSAKEAQSGTAFSCDGVGCVARVKGAEVAVARHPAAISDDCTAARVVVLNEPRPKFCDAKGLVIDLFDVWREGTHALYIDNAPTVGEAQGGFIKIRVDTVAAHRGERPWAPRWTPSLKTRSAKKDAAQVLLQPIIGDAPPSAPDKPSKGLPKFAGRPEFLTPLPPRPEIEDDEDAFDALSDGEQ
ncbi:MAG: ComEC/Rec2 family competence protein [Hyphomicrobium sp.]|nr:ComEC/Rec2 family competence protein [Hyphomicrobium sp.]